MTNAIQSIISYSGEDWNEYLESIGLGDMFKDLVAKYIDKKPVLKGIIQYIVWAYSKDSDKIVIGADWTANKKRIFDTVMLPPEEEIMRDVVELREPVILFAVKKWIEFQDEETWKEYMMLKDLRSEMQISSNSMLIGGNGINYDQKFKNAKYSIELTQMIKDCEQRLLQNDPHHKDAVREVKQKSKSSNISLSPEKFAI